MMPGPMLSRRLLHIILKVMRLHGLWTSTLTLTYWKNDYEDALVPFKRYSVVEKYIFVTQRGNLSRPKNVAGRISRQFGNIAHEVYLERFSRDGGGSPVISMTQGLSNHGFDGRTLKRPG